MRPLRLTAALLALGCVTSACDSDGIKLGPATRVTAMHAAPTYGQITFLREELNAAGNAATLNYRERASFSFEVGQYDFNLDVTPLDTLTTVRERSFSEMLEPDVDYYFVITEVGGLLEPLIVRKPAFAPSSGNAEVVLAHAAPTFAAVDVYLAPPGADLSSVNPIGGASFLQQVAPQTFAPGDYQLSFTEVGNPLNRFFASPTLTLAAGQTNVFVITDGAGEGVALADVLRIAGEASGLLTDLDTAAAVRAINAASDMQPRDIVVDGDFTTPLFAALPYGAPSGFTTIAPGGRNLAVTPAGNPGVIEAEGTVSILGGRAYTTLVAGTAGAIRTGQVLEDRRRISGEARPRFYNGAGQFTALDFYLLPPGTDVNFVIPLTLGPAESGTLPSQAPDDYELTIRISGTQTVAYGPAPITLAAGGLYGILALDGATAETAEVLFLDD